MRFLYPLFFVLFLSLPGRAAESYPPIDGRSYYEVLGVPSNADKDQIKRAFHARMKSLHPDLAGSPEKAAANLAETQNVSLVYSVLKDPDKRRRYDLYWLPRVTDGARADSYQGAQRDHGAQREQSAPDPKAERRATVMAMMQEALKRVQERYAQNAGLSSEQLAFVAQQTYLYHQRFLADTAINAEDLWMIFETSMSGYTTVETIGLAGGAILQLKERAYQPGMAAAADARLWQVRNWLLRDLNSPYSEGNTVAHELWQLLTGSYFAPTSQPARPQPSSPPPAGGNSSSCETVLRGQVRGSDGRLYNVEIPIKVEIKIGF